MFRSLPPALLVVLLTIASGCSSLSVQRPTASLRGAGVQDVSAEGVTVNFDLDVGNPNAVDIPLTRAGYKLALGGVQVIDDEARPAASVPANGSLPVTVPVRLSFRRLLEAERALVRERGNVPYDLDGVLEFTPPGGGPLAQSVRVPVRFQGTLAFRDAFEKVAQNPSVLFNADARRLIQAVLGRGGFLGDMLGR